MHHLDSSSAASSRPPDLAVLGGLTQQGRGGQLSWVSGESLELASICVLHSHLTLCMEIVVISSVVVCLIVMVVMVNG